MSTAGVPEAATGRGPRQLTATAVFTPADPAFVADPYPAYERLRAAGRVLYDPGSDHWLVPHHADVNALLRDRRFGRT
jgi:cytochrome P450